MPSDFPIVLPIPAFSAATGNARDSMAPNGLLGT